MDNNLTHKLKRIITENSYSLNGEVCSKLNQARQRALLGSNKKSFLLNQWLLPATALSAMLIYLLMPISEEYINQNRQVETVNYAAIEDIKNMEIIEQFELVEDLEFYEWLSSEDETSSI